MEDLPERIGSGGAPLSGPASHLTLSAQDPDRAYSPLMELRLSGSRRLHQGGCLHYIISSGACQGGIFMDASYSDGSRVIDHATGEEMAVSYTPTSPAPSSGPPIEREGLERLRQWTLGEHVYVADIRDALLELDARLTKLEQPFSGVFSTQDV